MTRMDPTQHAPTLIATRMRYGGMRVEAEGDGMYQDDNREDINYKQMGNMETNCRITSIHIATNRHAPHAQTHHITT